MSASERWLAAVRPLITAAPEGACAPGVSVMISSSVSSVLEPFRDAIGGAAIVVSPVNNIQPPLQGVTRAASRDQSFAYVLVGDVDGEVVLRAMKNHDFKRAVALCDSEVQKSHGNLDGVMATAAAAAERVRAASRGKRLAGEARLLAQQAMAFEADPSGLYDGGAHGV